MDVYEAIVGKRDTRDFSEEPVSDGHLRKVFQAGQPVGRHHQVLGHTADVGIGHPAPPKERREPSPWIPLGQLVDWGRWEA